MFWLALCFVLLYLLASTITIGGVTLVMCTIDRVRALLTRKPSVSK